MIRRVEVVNAGGFRAEISLQFVDLTFEVFLDKFVGYFSYHCGACKYANTPTILLLTVKDLSFTEFFHKRK